MVASATHESRLEFKFDELIASPKLDAPLIAGGVRCHGGFDANGNYVSPRTLWRNPAIRAWQERHRYEESLATLVAQVTATRIRGVAQALRVGE